MGGFLLPSLKGYKLSFLKNDILAGTMVAALTIPVAMGYAEVAGLPSIYGLYGSILPVLAYAIFASSPQLIFGMDSGASAITGAMILVLAGLTGSDAFTLAPQLALATAFFLILFALLRLGRFASYISEPVMAGFISGVSFTVLVSQIPKMVGLPSDGTDLFGNLTIIFTNLNNMNPVSIILAFLAIITTLLGKKLFPTLPITLIVLIAATLIVFLLGLDAFGVKIVGSVPQGFPTLSFPSLSQGYLFDIFGMALAIAIIVFSDSLLTSRSFALRNHYKLRENQELFAYGASNLASAFSGCSPTSSSVSRTAMSQEYKGKTQLVGITAAIWVTLIIVFFTQLLYYMPQPVLGAIVFCALLGLLGIKSALALKKRSESEFIILLVTVIGVVFVGVLFGIFLAVILSFIDFIRRSTFPPQAVLGKIPNRQGFFDLKRHPDAREVKGALIYRFSAPLFFANIQLFSDSILALVNQKGSPKTLVIDASGITSLDTTAASGLKDLARELKNKRVKYYLTDTIGSLRDQIRAYDLEKTFPQSLIKKTISEALTSKP